MSYAKDLCAYRMADVVAFDYETTGFDYFTDKVIGFSMSTKDAATYFWMDECTDADKALLKEILEAPLIKKLMWNAKFELHFSEAMDIYPKNVEDVMVMSVLSNENISHKLKDEAVAKLTPNAKDAQEAVKDALVAAGLNPKDFQLHEIAMIPAARAAIAEYGRRDAYFTFKLWEYYKDETEANYKNVYRTETELLQVVTDMEREGMEVDVGFLEHQKDALTKEADELAPGLLAAMAATASPTYLAVHPMADFDLASDDQLALLLTEGYGIVLPKTKKGNDSTNRYTLENLGDKWPLSADMIRYRQLRHVVATYCTGILSRHKDGVLHCDFQANGAKTGRFSCKNPNLQNIPTAVGDIRRAFTVPRGFTYVSFDLDQAELRVNAHYSGDDAFIAAFRKGEDLHALVARELYGQAEITDDQRKAGKTINFGVIYGMGKRTFSTKLSCSEEKAGEMRDSYFAAHPKVNELSRKCARTMKQRGYVHNLYSRRYRVRYEDAYKSLNRLIQGCVADLIKYKMVDCWKHLRGRKSKLVNQVHDDLLFKIHRSEMFLIDELKQIIECCPEYSVPITTTVKTSKTTWADMEKRK